MNRNSHSQRPAWPLVAAAVAATLVAACASAPKMPEGAAEARSKLTAMQQDRNLAGRAPVAVEDAVAAVKLAETPQPDARLAEHRVIIADRKVDTARALAEMEYAEFERTALTEQRERARLDARTREADAARMQARAAEAAGAAQQLDAERARDAAQAARASAADPQQEAQELQRQLDEMNARVTDQGLVLTLGDVLFTTGQADLRSGATGNLEKLAAFLTRYPERTAMIAGYTDSVGGDDFNQRLSERRAEAVKFYLAGQGVSPDRLSSIGKGESNPVADNSTAAGRQMNRRVEVNISDLPRASR